MIQTLVSVPSALAAWLPESPRAGARTPLGRFADFVASDPTGTKLGSGGGTVALLHSAWQAHPRGISMAEWLRRTPRLVLHAGGESRRLPAYAGIGKALLPVPPARQRPNRFDQVLADFQVPTYQQVLREAGDNCRMLVASGDVWLDLDPLMIPVVRSDIAGIGMRVSAEVAQHFGVYFVSKITATGNTHGPGEQPIAFFRQKPSPAEIYRHVAHYDFYVDTGLWLFSANAVAFLFRRCGWSESKHRFASAKNHPAHLDLYTEIGSALGTETRAPNKLRRLGWGTLRASVIPLDEARFFHVGSSRQLLDSYEHLVSTKLDRPKVFSFASPARDVANGSGNPVWVDAVRTTGTWQLGGSNIVSGATPKIPALRLEQGQCLEIAPTARDRCVVRPYSLDDEFRGNVGERASICGRDADLWLRQRGFPPTSDDVFTLPIYPVLGWRAVSQSLIDWFFAAEPSPGVSRFVLEAERVSAALIPSHINFDEYFRLRAAGQVASIVAQFESCVTTGDARVFDQDFAAIAELALRHVSLRRWLLRRGLYIVRRVVRPEHASRLLMLLSKLSPGTAQADYTQQAHRALQRGVVSSEHFEPARPRLALKEDQIVWGRSPVRLDLAGGWTDTPPYCLEYGGAVLNVAVLLNGQPPIQVFVRPLREPVINLRSIDLGSAEVVTTYAGLAGFRNPRSGFSLPKAALAMAGFHPDFSGSRSAATLRDRLARFGGGLEISMLSAVPKGSGLGTSSILAATILGALNRACGLGWDALSLYTRVLGVEQLLTTGGGWQDQAGALFRGIKLIETAPGPSQTPSVRYLPQHLFGPDDANRTTLLYYTGMTRLAKGILREIVQDMFVSHFRTLQTLGLVRANALALFSCIQQGDRSAVLRCIARSWNLNKRLDSGTSTPTIEAMLNRCEPDLIAAKLLGAGGGGYMLLCAADADAGQRIRAKLEEEPPNRRARFIDFEIANSGLEVTVS